MKYKRRHEDKGNFKVANTKKMIDDGVVINGRYKYIYKNPNGKMTFTIIGMPIWSMEYYKENCYSNFIVRDFK
jgi:hypothetical protein